MDRASNCCWRFIGREGDLGWLLLGQVGAPETGAGRELYRAQI